MIKTFTFEEQQDLLAICENIIRLLDPVLVVFAGTPVAKLVGQAKAFMAQAQYGVPASKATHTPGPWEFGRPHTLEEYDGKWHVRMLCGVNQGVLIHKAPWPVSPANVHLIEAAPDLLDACKALLKCLLENTRWDFPENVTPVKQARAALAKAEVQK